MSDDTSAKLKNLTTQIKRLEADWSNLDSEINDLKHKRTEINNKLRKLDEEVKKLKSGRSKVVVSEHAMLRFVERVHGLNLKELHAQILPEGSGQAIETLGSGKFPIGNPPTHYLVIRDWVVVTIELP